MTVRWRVMNAWKDLPVFICADTKHLILNIPKSFKALNKAIVLAGRLIKIAMRRTHPAPQLPSIALNKYTGPILKVHRLAIGVHAHRSALT